MKRISHPGWHSSIRFVLTTVVAILLIACGKKAADTSGAGSFATNDSGAGQNPCSLLEPKEVEAVIGSTLAGPPYRYNKTGKEGPAPDGDVCRYETAGYHFIEVAVEWTGGTQVMKMYGAVQNLADQNVKGVLKLADGSELTGEWDEAKVVTCCTFAARRGDQLVTVDVAGSNATLGQAAKIADAALKRIDKPLAVDAARGIAPALARVAARPKERDPCSLVSRADAETALESPLVKDPEVDGSKCIYTYTDKMQRSIGLEVSWRNGYAQFRQHAATAAVVGGALGLGGDASQKSSAADSALAGPWESAQRVQDKFLAVKNDVLITAGSFIASREEALARKLVATAISKL